jgi:hypothetical protein
MQSYGKSLDFSKVETISRRVKTHCRAFRLADTADFVYFCVEMKTIGRIAYWLAAIVVLAAILISLDYTLAQAVLVSLLFCPCALALEFFMPLARKPMEKVYLSLAVLVSVVLLIIVLHYCVWYEITSDRLVTNKKDIPPMLINPAFLGLILTALSFGDFLWAKWLSKRFKEQDRTVTFFSDRQSVTLKVEDIAYVESNDTEVRIITRDGESYRNKTGIGQWENLLGDGFLRIHRSYLVNLASASLASADTVTVGDTRLPVSRKYKEIVSSTLRQSSFLAPSEMTTS